MGTKPDPSPADPAPALTTPDRRRPDAQHILPGGGRQLVLTLGQVAEVLQTDVRTVRKLIKLQRAEDAAAQAEDRAPIIVGLRAKQLGSRLTRVTEQALGEYLHGSSGNSAR